MKPDCHLHRTPAQRPVDTEPRDENGRYCYLRERDTRPEIHLHDGHMRLYICGGMRQTSAWFPVTAPSSAKGPHGTPEERLIADKAVSWLRLHHAQNDELDAATIREALERFGWKPDPFTQYAA